MRVPLCKAWRGLNKSELIKVSGFKDIEFIHSTGFTGGTWSLNTAIKLVEMSIAEFKKNNPINEAIPKKLKKYQIVKVPGD